MDIEDYIIRQKELYETLIKYIENGNDSNDTYYQNLNKNLIDRKILENGKELKQFLNMILIVSKNHCRYTDFFTKIENILLLLKDSIKHTFSNLDLFNFFKNSKLILLFLLKKDILVLDKLICDKIIEREHYSYYFYPEIKLLIDEETRQKIEKKILNINPNIFEEFESKRHIGENDSYLCNLIRNDSINEFISYINEKGLSLSSQIEESIFETNSFLNKNPPTLIEYASFFRSIQIIQYLIKNGVELKPSLWFYAIHGRNQELINLLKENNVEPENKSYKKCFEESIKCHHNDIANSILDNFLKKEDEMKCNENNFDQNAIAYGFHYYNYSFIPKDKKNPLIFCYLCKYNYYTMVDILLKEDSSIINSSVIQSIYYK